MSATGRGAVRQVDDFYATPAWAVDAIVQKVGGAGLDCDVIDPCAGAGAILDRIPSPPGHDGLCGIELDLSRWESLRGKHARSYCADALHPGVRWRPKVTRPFKVITNPPYSLALEFVTKALEERPTVAAFLLRLNWLGSQKRADFHRQAPADVFILPRRPSFTGGGTDATEYAWFVWGLSKGGHWEIL